MADAALMALLAQHRALGPAPAAEHEWLAAHGERRTLELGSVVNAQGELVTSMYVVFSGRVTIRSDRGAGAHVIYQWRAGDVGGALPFSRGGRPPSDAIAEEVADVLAVPQEHFPELIRECPAVTATLVHRMLDRARQFNTVDLRDEKLVSLGKLAAGMAHELNNPASAAVRSAKLLVDGLREAELAASAMVAARLSDDQLAAITKVRESCASRPAAQVSGDGAPRRTSRAISAIARADREEELGDWLAARGVSDELAGPLMETGVTITALDELATHVSGEALTASLRWLAAGCLTRLIASELETSATRIYDLVNSIKGFTYMDQAPTPVPIDIRGGINDTLTVLGGKARKKNAEITVELADDLPRAHGVGAELNQVWMNLIDNAVDAIDDGGHIVVSANHELNHVVVRVVDDGAGIPPEIAGRVFDPFFTTKPVGKGTGMGLDTVRRIIQRHEGTVDVESAAGRTVFRVSLPAATD
jgi:signal transduction histidine kinase